MQTNTIKQIRVEMVLDQKEAEWLHGVMQNPLHGQSPEQESEEDKTMRFKFFNATTIPT